MKETQSNSFHACLVIVRKMQQIRWTFHQGLPRFLGIKHSRILGHFAKGRCGNLRVFYFTWDPLESSLWGRFHMHLHGVIMSKWTSNTQIKYVKVSAFPDCCMPSCVITGSALFAGLVHTGQGGHWHLPPKTTVPWQIAAWCELLDDTVWLPSTWHQDFSLHNTTQWAVVGDCSCHTWRYWCIIISKFAFQWRTPQFNSRSYPLTNSKQHNWLRRCYCLHVLYWYSLISLIICAELRREGEGERGREIPHTHQGIISEAKTEI